MTITDRFMTSQLPQRLKYDGLCGIACMLRNTFSHVPKVGRATEQYLWDKDILTWDEFIDRHESLDLPEAKKARIMDHVVRSVFELGQKNHKFFSQHLPAREHWRAYPDFKDTCCFLDIETTGMSRDYNSITMIGVYDGEKSRVFVQGQDMHEFEQEMRKYSMMVTFNGTTFDLPFIRTKFPGIDLDKLHVDLRYALSQLGFRGGLKRIEKEFGIKRCDDVDGMDGLEAIRLWYRYKQGDAAALELLTKYNLEDIENLKTIMDAAFPMLKSRYFFDAL